MHTVASRSIHSALLGLALLFFIFLGYGYAQAPGPNPVQAEPTRLAVLPFDVRFFTLDDLSANITDRIEEALFNTGRYKLIDRRTLRSVLREQGLGATELVDAKTAARIGQIVGVQVLILGSVDRLSIEHIASYPGVSLYRAVSQLSARAVDTATAEISAIARATGEARGAHPPARGRKSVSEAALDQAVKDLVTKLDAILQQKR